MSQSNKEYLSAKLFDAVRQCENNSVPKFVGFLDAAGVSAADLVAKKSAVRYMFWGGFKDAERLYFGVFPGWCEPAEDMFPIVTLKVINKSNTRFAHKDLLGAIMSLGLERDAVGDIIVGERDSYVSVSSSIADYIVGQLDKVASCGVEVVKTDQEIVTDTKRLVEASDTIASARLDCVVAALISCSRNRAAEVIESGLVSINGLVVLKVTKVANAGDKITVRHKGKFIIDSISDLTKKGRIILKYKKYT